MGLVADHDRVGVGDALRVADEPLVGLDRDRPVGVVLAVEQRRREPLLVAAVGDLADELVDEVAAVGEDQDPAGARGLDEAERGDGLAGAGRVLEPEAARGAGVLGRLVDRRPRRARLVDPVLRLLVGVERRRLELLVGRLAVRRRLLVAPSSGSACRTRAAAAAAGAVARSVARACCLGDQLGERPGERVDLVRGELGAVAQLRRLLGQQPLEPEQQREVAPPLDRGRLAAGLDLRERGVERRRRAVPGRQGLRALALEQERLAGELGRPLDLGA